jgi:hypothetical protein
MVQSSTGYRKAALKDPTIIVDGPQEGRVTEIEIVTDQTSEYPSGEQLWHPSHVSPREPRIKVTKRGIAARSHEVWKPERRGASLVFWRALIGSPFRQGKQPIETWRRNTHSAFIIIRATSHRGPTVRFLRSHCR